MDAWRPKHVEDYDTISVCDSESKSESVLSWLRYSDMCSLFTDVFI
jgi:hypothetical protein